MGNKASSAKRGSASSVASSVSSAVSSLVSGGGSGDHSSLAAASNNHKAAKIRATPDMAALVESLVAAIERRARDRSDAVLARQSVLIKEVEGVSSAVARLKSKTHDANSGAIQASQDIVHEMDLAKHHVLHILEMSEQVKAMLPEADAAGLPDSPFAS